MHKPVEGPAQPMRNRKTAITSVAFQGHRFDAGARWPLLRAHAGRLGRRRDPGRAPPEDGDASELVGRRDGSDFQNLHRNKRAITLNLKTDEAARS